MCSAKKAYNYSLLSRAIIHPLCCRLFATFTAPKRRKPPTTERNVVIMRLFACVAICVPTVPQERNVCAAMRQRCPHLKLIAQVIIFHLLFTVTCHHTPCNIASKQTNCPTNVGNDSLWQHNLILCRPLQHSVRHLAIVCKVTQHVIVVCVCGQKLKNIYVTLLNRSGKTIRLQSWLVVCLLTCCQQTRHWPCHNEYIGVA